MSRVFADAGVKILWLATIPTAALSALPVATLTAGKDLSDYAIVGDMQLEQAASDNNDKKAYSDLGKVSTPTYRNATGKGAFYRDRDNTGQVTTADPKSLFDNRQIGVFIKRKGVPCAAAWVIGQEYEYFKMQADAIHTVGDADGDYERFELDLNFKGAVGFGLVVA